MVMAQETRENDIRVVGHVVFELFWISLALFSFFIKTFDYQ